MRQAVADLWYYMGPLQGEVTGLAFSLLLVFILYLLRARVKLIYGRANNSRNVISVPDKVEQGKSIHTEIYVEKFFLQNVGRQVATNVEFILSEYPADIEVWQPRDVVYKTVAKGNCLVSIPQISSGELVIIDCAYINQKAAFITSVKCAEAVGKEVPFHTVRLFPQWVNYGIIGMLLFGVAFLVQIVFELVK